jgi:hypothetical protein
VWYSLKSWKRLKNINVWREPPIWKLQTYLVWERSIWSTPDLIAKGTTRFQLRNVNLFIACISSASNFNWICGDYQMQSQRNIFAEYDHRKLLKTDQSICITLEAGSVWIESLSKSGKKEDQARRSDPGDHAQISDTYARIQAPMPRATHLWCWSWWPSREDIRAPCP